MSGYSNNDWLILNVHFSLHSQIFSNLLNHFDARHHGHVEIGEYELVFCVDLVGLFDLVDSFLGTHEEVHAVIDVYSSIEQYSPHHRQAEFFVIHNHDSFTQKLLVQIELIVDLNDAITPLYFFKLIDFNI